MKALSELKSVRMDIWTILRLSITGLRISGCTKKGWCNNVYAWTEKQRVQKMKYLQYDRDKRNCIASHEVVVTYHLRTSKGLRTAAGCRPLQHRCYNCTKCMPHRKKGWLYLPIWGFQDNLNAALKWSHLTNEVTHSRLLQELHLRHTMDYWASTVFCFRLKMPQVHFNAQWKGYCQLLKCNWQST